MMISVVVSMRASSLLRIAQPEILAFGQRLAGRPVPVPPRGEMARVMTPALR